MVTGPEIKKARQRAGLSQAKLAEMLEVTPRTVGGWERGEVSPGTAQQRLVDLLNLDAEVRLDSPLARVDDHDLLAEVARRMVRAREKVGTDSGTSAEKSDDGPELSHGEATDLEVDTDPSMRLPASSDETSP